MGTGSISPGNEEIHFSLAVRGLPGPEPQFGFAVRRRAGQHFLGYELLGDRSTMDGKQVGLLDEVGIDIQRGVHQADVQEKEFGYARIRIDGQGYSLTRGVVHQADDSGLLQGFDGRADFPGCPDSIDLVEFESASSALPRPGGT